MRENLKSNFGVKTNNYISLEYNEKTSIKLSKNSFLSCAQRINSDFNIKVKKLLKSSATNLDDIFDDHEQVESKTEEFNLMYCLFESPLTRSVLLVSP